ncbi:hypothetical protein C9E82_13300 [Paracoccus siganidrum]|uniref:Uncharacterized protein n=1 Tax=Paracoccus siganidrum TaxID=1276757 RepID=A0A419A6D4_9RHOB|nr:hypothetical protein D3P05_11880 [Paracoccus siganidrum]RMC33500.1 hypothetical protein C9E82_13300 [Paracoccus siganidrum]
MAAADPEIKDRMAIEAQRCRVMMAAAALPEECGDEIAPSPARGGFVLERFRHLEEGRDDEFIQTSKGYVRRLPVRRADAFDAMIAAALRAKRDEMPLSYGQIAIGRRYHDLVEMLSSDGTKLSQLQGSTGSGDNGGWMDRRLALSAELAGMRRRIGNGVAMAVRRIRPSDRGSKARGTITDRVLVDMVCLQGRGIKAILLAHGWQDDGRNKKALREALSASLDRMMGYRAEKSS